jgi:hypothetical protein
MKDMGFLNKKMSDAEKEQISDLYTIFKCNKEQNIMAENLETLLLIISGLRDELKVIGNDIQNNKWMMSGAYEEDSGIYFIREGEHSLILQHFDLLHITRLQ